jgi:hypothetical protein
VVPVNIALLKECALVDVPSCYKHRTPKGVLKPAVNEKLSFDGFKNEIPNGALTFDTDSTTAQTVAIIDLLGKAL